MICYDSYDDGDDDDDDDSDDNLHDDLSSFKLKTMLH